MKKVRVNITLTESVVKKLSKIKNKSQFIEDSVKNKFEEIERDQMEKLLREGYSSTYEEDKEIDKEWDILSSDGLNDVS